MKMKLEDVRALRELGLDVESYHRLVMYLKIENQIEAEKLTQTPRIIFEVKAIAEYLNSKKRLPEKFKNLVDKYKCFEGVSLEDEKFSF